MRNHQLHVIRSDVLLWRLGGFEPNAGTEPIRDKHRPLLPWQVAEIMRLAKRPLNTRGGTIKAFAERADIPYRSVMVMMHRVRRGTEPRRWRKLLA
jgi:hypothetical protein